MPEPAFGGGIFIADKSVWARAGQPHLRAEWAMALRARQIATCSIVRLELLYSARDAQELASLERDLTALRDVPVTPSVQREAVRATHELADRSPLYHRVPLPDVLIAATAQDVGVGVLHVDRHFDRLAEVLAFESRWAADPGEL